MDIFDRLLGEAPAKSQAPTKGQEADPFLHQNLTQDMIDRGVIGMNEMGLNPRDVLTNPEKFNSYPLPIRQKFFAVMGGAPTAASVAPPATNQPIQAGDIFDRLLNQGAAPAAPARNPMVSPESVPSPMQAAPASPAAPARKSKSFGDFLQALKPDILPAADTALTLGAGIVTGPIAMIKQGIEDTQARKEMRGPKDVAGEFMGKYSYQPRTEEARQTIEKLGEFAEVSKIPPVLTPELMAVAPATQNVGTQLTTKGRSAIPGEVPPVTGKVEPTMGKPRVSYAEFQQALQARKQGGIVPPPLVPQPSPTMPRPTTIDPFPEVRYAPKGAVPLTEQEARKGVLGRIGLDSARESSIKGDGFGAANEYQTSKTDTAVGQLFRDTLAKERNALETFGQKIVERTGGSFGLDETALYDRGTRIAKPFDDFKAALQAEMSEAYKKATEVAAGRPSVIPTNLQRFLDTDSNFTVNDSFMALRRGIQSHLKENGLLDKDGRVMPMTVEQAENLRKYVNSNWNNERSGIIGRMKDKIDNDVTKVAGEDVYKKARDIRTQIARLLDDPKGVSKIMDYDPQSPMNRAVPFEKIATTIERMDVDQQMHLVRLLKQMPENLRPQADAAIAEIKAHLANRILQEGSKNKGQWNASNVSKYLKDNNKKLAVLMEDPEIAQMVRDLNAAGHILKYDASYPGAAIQAHNLTKLGVPLLGSLGGAVGTTVGGVTGGGFGAALGGTIGGAMGAKRGAKMAEKSALKRGQKKMIPLGDVGKGN